MAKVTLRIPLYPKHPEKFINLMKKVVEKHEAEGASSPLNVPGFVDMADFKAKLLQADALREESIQHRIMAESKMGQAKGLLGISAGQNINHEGTLYNMLDKIKKLLLVKFSGEAESLSPYGFDVVIGTAKGVGRPRKNR